MRDRLIELLDEYTEPLSARDIHKADFAEKFADHLLAEGVIVPPCKVGDTVYYISRYYTGKFQVYECVVDKITVYETNIFLSLFDVKDRGINFGVNCYDPSLYFTRDEAERALERIKV